MKHPGTGRNGHPLNNQRKQGDEEHDIENLLRTRNSGYYRIGGEDDGDRPTKTDPGHEPTGPMGHTPERKQAQEDTDRTGYQNHEQGNEYRYPCYIQHLVRIDQQTQRKEHHNLEKPGKTVHERVDFLTECQTGIPYHHPSNIDGQIAISLQQIGCGEGNEHQTQQQDGIERSIGQFDLVDEPHRELTESKTDDSPEKELNEQVLCHTADAQVASASHHLDEGNGQHVSHGVITTTLQLQHRTKVFLQVHFLRTEQIEYGSRIGGRHGGCQQQTGQQRQSDIRRSGRRKKIDEPTGKQGSDQHPYRGEQDSLCQYGTDVVQLGIHPACEKDDTQCHHTDELGIRSTIELQPQSITTETHTDQQEKQERRDAETIPSLTNQNTTKNKYSSYQ